MKRKVGGERFETEQRIRVEAPKPLHPYTSAMLILFGLLTFGIIAIAWLVYEPISGIVGSAFIAKIMALVVAFKVISAVAGWLMGPAVVRIPL